MPGIVALIERRPAERPLHRQQASVVVTARRARHRRRRADSSLHGCRSRCRLPTRRRPRSPRAARSARALARDEVRLLVSRGDRRAGPRHVHRPARRSSRPATSLVVNTSATMPAAVDAVLADGDAARRLTCRPSCPAALWMVEPRRRIADGSTVAAAARRRAGHRPSLADGTAMSTCSGRRRGRAGCGWRSPPTTSTCSTVLVAGTAGRSATATSTATGRSTAYQTVFADRAGQRRDAERGPAVHRRDRRPGWSAAASASPRSCCTPACRRSRVTSCRTPSATAVPRATAALGQRHPRAGGHVIAVGTTVVRALETGSRRRRAPCTRRRAGPMLVITPERGRPRRRRPAHRAGTSPRPPTWRCSRRSPGATALDRAPTRRRARAATCGTSSATATCCFPTLESMR